MKRLLIAVIVVLALTAPAVASAFDAPFRTPSGNIRCEAYAQERQVQCAVMSTRDGGGYITRYTLFESGLVTTDHFYKTSPLRGRILQYGRSISVATIKCVSRQSGLRCESTVSHHGFILSRERQVQF